MSVPTQLAGTASWIARAAMCAGAAALFAATIVHPALPWWARAVIAGLAVLAWVRPVDALVVALAFIPIAGRALEFRAQGSLAFALPVVLAYLARSLGRGVVARTSPAIVLMIAIVLASAAVELMLDARLEPDWRTGAREWFTRDFLHPQPRVLDASLLWLIGIGLWCAVRRDVRTLDEARRVLWAIVVGTTAAAVVTVERLIQALIRLDDRLTLIAAIGERVRFDAVFGDVNAAASVYLLALIAALALLRGTWMQRMTAVMAMVASLLALWIAGSKTALAALGAIALPAAVYQAARGRTRRTRLLALTSALAILALAAGMVRSAPNRVAGSATSLQFRMGFLETSMGMMRESPVFGLGIGRYYNAYPNYAPEWLVGHYAHENAHNIYLQVAAELGAIGLAAFLWLIVESLVAGGRRRPESAPWSLTAAMLGVLITCLTGHPLLVAPIAMMFWAALGLHAGWGDASTPPRPRARWVWPATIGTVVAVLLSIPVRANFRLADLDLTHVAQGVSRWSPADSPPRVRTVGRHARFHVPGNVVGVEFNLQRSPHVTEPVSVELRFDGRTADRLLLNDDEWHVVHIPILSGGDRFHEVELVVSGPPNASSDLRIDAGVRMTWIRTVGER